MGIKSRKKWTGRAVAYLRNRDVKKGNAAIYLSRFRKPDMLMRAVTIIGKAVA